MDTNQNLMAILFLILFCAALFIALYGNKKERCTGKKEPATGKKWSKEESIVVAYLSLQQKVEDETFDMLSGWMYRSPISLIIRVKKLSSKNRSKNGSTKRDIESYEELIRMYPDDRGSEFLRAFRSIVKRDADWIYNYQDLNLLR